MSDRQKGARGEREVGALLAAWWQPVEPATVFVRTPRSGGWAHAEAFRACGDVMVSPSSCFPFSVEVKRRERWSLRNVACGGPSPVWTWWRQAQTDAARLGLEPMLWARHQRQPWLVLVRYELVASVECAPPPAWSWGLIHAEVGAQPVAYDGAVWLRSDPRIWTHRAGRGR